ncbi:MAG: serine hydrolase [Pseudomonadota bacterium]
MAGLLAAAATPTHAEDAKWGRAAGYPSGWGSPPRLSLHPERRVANFSGGFESMLRTRTIQAAAALPWRERSAVDLRYRWGLFSRTPDEYLDAYPITGLLIARKGEILLEKYRFDRKADMRLTSWSMAKSVTSLLLGIAVDQKRIASMDDTAETYLPALAGTLHGGTTLRNLGNMSSGAAIEHEQGNTTIYPGALSNRNASIADVVKGWNARQEPQGTRFNYNELCPLTIGMVIRAKTGKSLSEYAQEVLWQPLGAEANATWSTDSHGDEFNCIGFAARLRDWARLGQLVAQRGRIEGRQIVSTAWMDDYSRWEASEAQARYGNLPGRKGAGYKRFFWHARADGTLPYFNGAYGQRVLVDLRTETVLVQTAVADGAAWQDELFTMFAAATAVPG